MLLGGAPIVRASTYEVTRETEAYDIGTALAQGKSVRVPGDMWGPNGTPQVGRKVLIEFIETLNLETDERTLTKAKVVENIGGLHRIIRPESLLSKLGLRGQHLTIRLKWANGVERNSLRTAGKVVSQLTGWKTHIDSAPDVRLNQHADRIAELGKTISETKDPAVHRVALVALQDVIDEISPTRGDVEDLPNVIILVLPKLPGIPFTTAGDVATGVTKHWLYSVMFMPPKFGPVQLVSEACAACSKNYAKGRDYDYASHFGLLIIHESLHVAAELRDHRGECRLCTYDREEMLPLRYEHCEDCIGHEGNYTHQNCIMSYACQFCIASRIRELKGLSDILCNQCHSRIPETSLILSSYYFRVNSLLYRDLVMKALSTSTRERLNVARKTREQERSSPTIK